MTAAAERQFSLYDELARRRRAVWLYSGLCLAVASALGVALSSIITPILLLIAGLALRLAARLGVAPDLPARGADAIRGWARYQITNFGELLAATDKVHAAGGLVAALGPLERLSTVAIPALVAGALVWFALRSLNLRSGGGDLVDRLAARAPNQNDPNERRLGELVEEVAIAAGAPAPRLFVIDQATVNAAAIGTSPKDAVILVTRGLVDTLDKAETEAAMGRLVATICAGDLRVAQSIFAAVQTFAFFLTVLDLPVSRSAWRTLGELALLVVSPRPSPQRIAGIAGRLDASRYAQSIGGVKRLIAKFPSQALGVIVTAPLAPFIVMSGLFKTVLFLWTAFFLGPPLGLIWRNRCLWADAVAARRNLDPEALASALQKMTDVPPGAESQAYLFIGGALTKRRAVTDRRSMTLALAPSTPVRVQRLAMLGAAPSGMGPQARTPGSGAHTLLVAVQVLVLAPLGLMLVALIGLLTIMTMSIALAAGLFLVAAVV